MLAEEQAGISPGWSTVEHIFNGFVITEKLLQHRCNLFHNFTDFKKVFDRVWHVGLWQVLRSFNMHEELVQATKAQYENSSSAVLFNSQQWKFFKTIVGVPSGMLTLTRPVQFVTREDHTGNAPRPTHIHLHWWKAHMQPTILLLADDKLDICQVNLKTSPTDP